MSVKDKYEYLIAMPKVRAGEILDELRIVAYPNLKQEKDQDALWKSMAELASFIEPVELEGVELAKALRFM